MDVGEQLGADPLADLTVESAGRILGRSASTVRDYARQRLLPGSYKQRGREWCIPHEAIRAFQKAEASRTHREPRMSSRSQPWATGADLSGWKEEFGG